MLLSFSAAPSSSALSACLGALLLLGPCLVLVVVAELVAGRLARLPWLSRGRTLLLLATLYVFLFGAWLSNVCLIDSALQKRTLIGYGFSALVALASALLVRRLLRTPSVAGPLASATPAGFGLLCCVPLGVTVSWLDTSFLPEGYWLFHVGMLGVGCAVYSLLGYSLVTSQRRASVACGAALLAFALLGVTSARAGAHEVYVTMSGNSTLLRRSLLLSRKLLDRDGDGYSSALEGGDCNDADPKAYPLSLVGKDCLGWVDAGQRAPLALLPPKTVDRGPLLIVLVTVDALRCHDVVAGEHVFQDACAELGSLAKAGRSRDDAHTNFPSTGHAIGSLHAAMPFFRSEDKSRVLLASWMNEQGRYTQAVSTHRNQMPPYIARSFRQVDTELQPLAAQGSSATSAQVTERTLRAIDDALAARRSTFLWSHYYDPHAPYVATPGSPWAVASNRERYLSEVRRVNAELRRLTAGIASRTDSALVLITADHGEEFEEKAARNHGATLDEAATRIPMVLWSPSQARLPAGAELPASLAEVAPFLASVVTGQPFVSSNEAFFWTGTPALRIVGYYQGGNKLTYNEVLNLVELFDVKADRSELNNLAAERPQLRQLLGARLARYLVAPVSQRPDAGAGED